MVEPTEAKAVCARCPVCEPCLTFGLLTGDTFHVLGGTTPAERRELDNGQRVGSCARCGRDFVWNKTAGGARAELCPDCTSGDPTIALYAEVTQ